MQGPTKDIEAYEQDTDIFLMLALAKHVHRKSFIDVGAEKGSFARPLLEMGFRGFLFEPFSGHLPTLRALVDGTTSQVFDFALDEADHDGLFHIAVDDQGHARDYFHSLIRSEGHPNVRHAQSVAVQCRSLASLAREGLIDPEVGILKIDTEGNDLNVIRGMGDLRVEVLICEFVTPRLYGSWTGSFPEALVEAAALKGFDACIAVKRMGRQELVVFGPLSFVDGQWGNLIFTSQELLRRGRTELRQIAGDSERNLFEWLRRYPKTLEEKEAVIKDLAGYVERASGMVKEKEAAIHDLSASLKEKEGAIQELTLACQEKESAIRELTLACQEKEGAIRELTQACQEKEGVIHELTLACQERLTRLNELADELRHLQLHMSPDDWERR